MSEAMILRVFVNMVKDCHVPVWILTTSGWVYLTDYGVHPFFHDDVLPSLLSLPNQWLEL